MRNHWLNQSLHLWEVDDGEQHWYAASSAERALELHFEPLRDPKTGKVDCWNDLGIEEEKIEVNQVPDTKILTVRSDDTGEDEKKTALEWCQEGEGIVATTFY